MREYQDSDLGLLTQVAHCRSPESPEHRSWSSYLRNPRQRILSEHQCPAGQETDVLGTSVWMCVWTLDVPGRAGHILKDCRMRKAFQAKVGSQGKGKGKATHGKGKVKARGGKSNQGNMRAIAGLQESQEEDWLNGDVDPEAETEVEDCDKEEEDQESGNA